MTTINILEFGEGCHSFYRMLNKRLKNACALFIYLRVIIYLVVVVVAVVVVVKRLCGINLCKRYHSLKTNFKLQNQEKKSEYINKLIKKKEKKSINP